MTLLDNIEKLCEKENISIYRLEKACGLSRSSINKWDVSSPKIENLQKVADYFGVSVDYLLGKKEYYANEETAEIAQEVFENTDMRMLFDISKDLSPAEMKSVINMLKTLKNGQYS